jgi:tRNA(Ile2) C34 agmatinyltransferase TiaS
VSENENRDLGFYRQIPVPETITCSRCGEERNSIGQRDGLCLKCRWELKREARQAGAT